MNAKRGPGASTHRATNQNIKRNQNTNTPIVQAKIQRFAPPKWCGQMSRYLAGEVECGRPAFCGVSAFLKIAFGKGGAK